MSEHSSSHHKISSEVELVTDGESLLVVGDKRRDVKKFLKAHGLLEHAQKFGDKNLVPILRASGDLAHSVSETVKESGMWLKLTEESAAAVKEYGLMDSKQSGVAHAMVGKPGDIKKWLSVDVSATAKFANPAVLSGVGSSLTQTSREQEAAQLRILLEKIGQKVEKILQGQRYDILGDLAGIERTIQEAMYVRELEGTIDQLTWSKIDGAPMNVRQVQAKALLNLDGIAADLEKKQDFKELKMDIESAKAEVETWLSTIARCTIALDELTVLELDHYAELEPGNLENRRLTLSTARGHDQESLLKSIAGLMARMDRAAGEADDHKILHAIAVPRMLKSIDSAREAVATFSEAVGMNIDWEKYDATQWLEAIREWEQWKNAGGSLGKFALEKGAPAVGTLALAAITAIVTKKLPGKPDA